MGKVYLWLVFLILLIHVVNAEILDAEILEEKFKQKYGKEWNAEINDNTNSMKRLIGYNIDIKNKKTEVKSLIASNEDIIDSALKDFIQNNSNFFNINIEELEKGRVDYEKSHRKEFESGNWYVSYKQKYDGIPVYNGYLNFVIINDKIVSVSNNFYPNINISITPLLSKEDALDKVKKDTSYDNILLYNASLMIYSDETKKPIEYHLAWYILIDDWEYFIDANGGEVLYKETTLRDNTITGTVTGTVTGMAYIPNSKFSQRLVNISNNNITAIHDGSIILYNITQNRTGFYNISGINGTLEVVAYLEGPYVKVFNGTTNRVNHTFIASPILTNFSNGLKAENLTYSSSTNITRQINITKDNKIVNAKLTLKGFNNTALYSTNASESSAPFYNFTNIQNNARDFIFTIGQVNFTCINYTFHIYNYSSGSWCSFAQNTIEQDCTGGIESKVFRLENTSCNDFSNFISNNKVQLNLSGINNTELVRLNYSVVNLSSPQNLTIFINTTQTYFNSTFNTESRISLNVSLLQSVLESCQENSSDNKCLINITFYVAVDINSSQLEYSELNITHIIPQHNFNWNESDNSIRDEETNVFYHINVVHDLFNKGDPFNVSGINYQITARTEALGVCNADFSSTTRTIRFAKNNLCDDNIALDSDVIYHEYTHAVVNAIYTTLPYTGQTGAMDEGFADFWAAVLNNDSKIGDSSFSNGRGDSTCTDCLRNINNTIRKPTSWSEVHSDSRSFSGALWDARELLGAVDAEPLIMRAMKAQPHSFSEMLDNILLFNDNNGNIADGTPNSSLICRAFTTNHGIQSPFCNSSLGSYQTNDSMGSKFFDAVANGRIIGSSESTDGVEGMADDDITIPIDIGFNFTFFNINYSQIYIGSDGIVFFENHTINVFNDFPDVIPIADFSTPNNFISLYRHDSNPGASDNGGGDVYYWKDTNNNRFIVEWFQVRPFGSTNNETLELIIYKDGRMIFQYLNITDSTVTNVTVGIENTGGTFGINYINASNLDNLEPFGICFLPVGSSLNCSNPPTVINATISSSDFLNRTNATLQGIVYSSDIDGDRITNETRWYKNGEEITQLRNITSVSPQNTTKGDNWNFSVRVFDGTDYSSFVNVSINIKNAAPIINITITNDVVNNITVSETQKVNITRNASDIDNDALSFTINDTRFSLNDINYIWNTTLADAGTYYVNITVNDTELIDSKIITVIVLDARDIDNDGVPDFSDDDDDNDGISDENDFLIGNVSSINTTIPLNIAVNGSSNLSKLFNGTFTINITNGSDLLVEFNFTFNSSNILDFGNLTFNRSTSGSGASSIRGVRLLNSTKTFFIEKINTTAKSVCIKDIDTSFDSISSTCDSANETLLTCDNSSSGQYACFDTGTRYKITGLNHSAVKEQCRDVDGDGYGAVEGCTAGIDCNDNDRSKTTDCSTPSSGSSGGGNSGGGGGGGGGSIGYVCAMDWKCNDWSQCIDGTQTRQCEFAKVPQHWQETPCPTLSNAPISSQKCEVAITKPQALEPAVLSENGDNKTKPPAIEQEVLSNETIKQPSISGFVIKDLISQKYTTPIIIAISLIAVIIVIGLVVKSKFRNKPQN